MLDNLDLGDFLGVDGRLIRTRTGELTLAADNLVMLSKSLRPLPEKWHGSPMSRLAIAGAISTSSSTRASTVFEIRAALVRE